MLLGIVGIMLLGLGIKANLVVLQWQEGKYGDI